MHGPVRVPEKAGIGTAAVALSFDAWKEGGVASSRQQLEVVAPKPGLKPEPVSTRLKGELMHPNKTSVLSGLRFAADGSKLIGGDYPGGVVVLWDVASGKQLAVIETGYGYRGSADYIFLSADWQTLFVSRESRKYERVEKDGQRLTRWEFDGQVRGWDLGSGKLVRTYKHEPPRNVRAMQMSPDSTMFITAEEMPGVYERGPKGGVTLWNVKTGQPTALPDRLSGLGIFSPDSRSYATTADDDGYTRALKLFDIPSGKEKWSVPVSDKAAWVNFWAFSPDSRLLVMNHRVFGKPGKFDLEQSRLALLDAESGHEVGELAQEKDATFSTTRFSPDGGKLASVTWSAASRRGLEDTKKLYLFSVTEKRPPQVIVLGTAAKGKRLITREPVFSPNGKWLAIITQVLPDTSSDLDAHDVPQARIHLIDVASGTIRETLIAPQGFPTAGCFSPDGRTLATGGHGRVLLWDVSHLPDIGKIME